MRRGDTFLTQDRCDRCGNPLHVRILSWFNEDTICMDCSDKEKPIKAALREKGIESAMEGCGYVPDPEKVENMT